MEQMMGELQESHKEMDDLYDSERVIAQCFAVMVSFEYQEVNSIIHRLQEEESLCNLTLTTEFHMLAVL